MREIIVAALAVVALSTGCSQDLPPAEDIHPNNSLRNVSGGVDIDVETIRPVPVVTQGFSRAPGNTESGTVFPVKFVCGLILPGTDFEENLVRDGPLSPGEYRTAINLVNLSGKSVTFKKRATQTLPQNPENIRGHVGNAVDETLLSHEGLTIDCFNIRDLLEGPDSVFLEGFVVIETDQPLSVSAVYSVDKESVSGFLGQRNACTDRIFSARAERATFDKMWRDVEC